jgi:hypothetical protein
MYTDPNILIAYSDVKFDQSPISRARRKSGPASWLFDGESTESAWTGLLRAVELSLTESEWRRLRDVISSRQQATAFLRQPR